MLLVLSLPLLIYRVCMNEELEVLDYITHALHNAKIEYMLTGSVAANYYAEPRMTRDIDIVIELQDKDVETITQLFQDDFYIDDNS